MISKRVSTLLVYILAVPLAVGVALTTLLYMGVPPSLIFFPGNALKAFFVALGWPVHNRVGVIVTGMFWWLLAVGCLRVVKRFACNAA